MLASVLKSCWSVRYGGEDSKWLPHIDRLTYIYKANQRFYKMLAAWEAGDIETVGSIFREDGIGLRDEYVLTRLHPDRLPLLWFRVYAKYIVYSQVISVG